MKKFFLAGAYLSLLLALPLSVTGLAADEALDDPSKIETSLSDAKITSFAKAQISMHRIFMKYQPEMEKTEKTVEERKELQEKIIEEMSQALESEGLTQAEYNEITKKAGQDKELYQRLSKEMVEVQKVVPTSPPIPAPATPEKTAQN